MGCGASHAAQNPDGDPDRSNDRSWSFVSSSPPCNALSAHWDALVYNMPDQSAAAGTYSNGGYGTKAASRPLVSSASSPNPFAGLLQLLELQTSVGIHIAAGPQLILSAYRERQETWWSIASHLGRCNR